MELEAFGHGSRPMKKLRNAAELGKPYIPLVCLLWTPLTPSVPLRRREGSQSAVMRFSVKL